MSTCKTAQRKAPARRGFLIWLLPENLPHATEWLMFINRCCRGDSQNSRRVNKATNRTRTSCLSSRIFAFGSGRDLPRIRPCKRIILEFYSAVNALRVLRFWTTSSMRPSDRFRGNAFPTPSFGVPLDYRHECSLTCRHLLISSGSLNTLHRAAKGPVLATRPGLIYTSLQEINYGACSVFSFPRMIRRPPPLEPPRLGLRM